MSLSSNQIFIRKIVNLWLHFIKKLRSLSFELSKSSHLVVPLFCWLHSLPSSLDGDRSASCVLSFSSALRFAVRSPPEGAPFSTVSVSYSSNIELQEKNNEKAIEFTKHVPYSQTRTKFRFGLRMVFFRASSFVHFDRSEEVGA